MVVALPLRHHGRGAERGQSSRCRLGVGGGSMRMGQWQGMDQLDIVHLEQGVLGSAA